MSGEPDPKPERRLIDPAAGKEKVDLEGRCRVCRRRALSWWMGGSHLNGLTRAHLVPRSRGGDDVDANIIGLCGMGGGTCHPLSEARDLGIRMAIRAAMTEEEEQYVRQKTKGDWLERNYPSRVEPPNLKTRKVGQSRKRKTRSKDHEIVGRTYLFWGEPLVVLDCWGGEDVEDERYRHRHRMVRVQREDGSVFERRLQGLRLPPSAS